MEPTEEIKSENSAASVGTTNPGDKSSTPGNAFANALKIWTEIDLPSLQRKLDDQGIELKGESKSSLQSRKNLASKTKEFRKLEDSEKLTQFPGLLKLYQKEIDELATKKKTAENYFFGTYRLLAEAPDPRPLLEISLDAVADFSEVESLKEQINKLQEELSKKADYEQLKQRLLRNEQKSAEILSSSLAAKEAELQAVADERERNWKEKEIQYTKQISEAKKKIEELRTNNEVLQLKGKNSVDTDETSGYEKASASVLAELEMTQRETESAKKRIFELEQRNEILRRDLSKTQNALESQSLKEEYEKKINELEGENALLIANVDNFRRNFESLKEKNHNEIESLSKQVQSLQNECQRSRVQIDKMGDYEELKEEIKLLKQIEFGEDPTLIEEDHNNEGVTKSVDQALIQKNKQLTSELAELRSQHDSLVSQIETLKNKLEVNAEELTRSQLLNDKLEKDLAEVQEPNSNGFNDTASLVSRLTMGIRNGPIGSGGSINGSITGSSNVQDESSILPIITKQRDRFRDRNSELEEELRRQYSTVSELKRQMNHLKRDNEELYERTRYLAQYRSNHGGATNRLQPKPNVTDLENPYAASYEQKLHPIEQFRIKEQERISSKLSPIERLFISFSRAVLATRTTRLLFVIYCLGLHCVIFFTSIYVMSLHSHLIPEVGKNVSTGGVAAAGITNPDIGNAGIGNAGSL